MADYMQTRNVEDEISEWLRVYPNESDAQVQWMREHPQQWGLVRLPSDGRIVMVRSETRQIAEAVKDLWTSLANKAFAAGGSRRKRYYGHRTGHDQ